MTWQSQSCFSGQIPPSSVAAGWEKCYPGVSTRCQTEVPILKHFYTSVTFLKQSRIFYYYYFGGEGGRGHSKDSWIAVPRNSFRWFNFMAGRRANPFIEEVAHRNIKLSGHWPCSTWRRRKAEDRAELGGRYRLVSKWHSRPQSCGGLDALQAWVVWSSELSLPLLLMSLHRTDKELVPDKEKY